MPNATAEKRYLTIREAAQYSTLSVRGIYRLIAAGKLAASRPTPNRVVIDRKRLERLIESSAV